MIFNFAKVLCKPDKVAFGNQIFYANRAFANWNHSVLQITDKITKSKRLALIGSQINASLDRNVKMNILQDVENIWTGEIVKRKTANLNIQRCAEI